MWRLPIPQLPLPEHMERMTASQWDDWMHNLRSDRNAYTGAYKLFLLSDSKQDRIFYLAMMAISRRCIATDLRMLRGLREELSLCADHENIRDCTCVAPF